MPHAQDPDALYDDAPVARIEIICRRDGALTVAGSIEHEAYALAVLANAADALRSFHAHRRTYILVPPRDVALPSR